jgi:AraC family transcriptional regulator
VPALPEPLYTMHIAGQQHNRTWLNGGWSESVSMPGCATIVPAGQQTGWLIDGELDVVTLSVSSDQLSKAPPPTSSARCALPSSTRWARR